MKNILSHIPTIETERLILRPLSFADDAAIYAYASDPEVTKFVSFDTARSIEDTRIFLNTALENYSKGIDPASLAITLKKENKLIGGIGWLNWSDLHKRIEIGYVLARPEWNKGYVSEAVIAFIGYSFTNSDLIRIEARCVRENAASAKVMEKAGMSYEGTLRKHQFFKGEQCDMKIYSVIRDEWLRQSDH